MKQYNWLRLYCSQSSVGECVPVCACMCVHVSVCMCVWGAGCGRGARWPERAVVLSGCACFSEETQQSSVSGTQVTTLCSKLRDEHLGSLRHSPRRSFFSALSTPCDSHMLPGASLPGRRVLPAQGCSYVTKSDNLALPWSLHYRQAESPSHLCLFRLPL